MNEEDMYLYCKYPFQCFMYILTEGNASEQGINPYIHYDREDLADYVRKMFLDISFRGIMGVT